MKNSSEHAEHAMIAMGKSLDKVQTIRDSNLLQVHEHQCQYLCDRLFKAVKRSQRCFGRSSPQQIQELQEIFRKLSHIAVYVEVLVTECSQECWMETAVTLRNVTEHVAKLVFELKWYTALLSSTIDRGLENVDTRELLNWVDTEDEHFIIERKAKYDRHSLLLKLELSDSANVLRTPLLESLQNDSNLVNFTPKDEFMSMLGQGLHGSVYKTNWLGQSCAMKVFKGGWSSSFEKEANIMALLVHPNITSIYFVHKEKSAIFMELMDEDLRHLMDRRRSRRDLLERGGPYEHPFEHLEAVDIIIQIAEGMRYLHHNHFSHRDLKPQNILVKRVEGTEDLETCYLLVKISDFGLSKARAFITDNSSYTMGEGTRAYMAPELAFGVEHNEVLVAKHPLEADIFSFGVLCYEILTGKRPFEGMRGHDAIMLQRQGVMPILPNGFPEDLVNLLSKCWSLNPALRPSFDDICTHLRNYEAGFMIGKFEQRATDLFGLIIIKRVRKKMEDIHMNRHQCMRLMTVFDQIEIFIKELDNINPSVSDNSNVGKALFSELLRVLEKGEDLIMAYTQENWYKSLISWGVNSQSFQVIHSELGRCITNLNVNSPNLIKLSRTFRALVFRKWAENLESDAKDDHTEILKKLNDMRKVLLQLPTQTAGIEISSSHQQESADQKKRDQELLYLHVATEKVHNSEETSNVKKIGDGTIDLPTYLQINPGDIVLGKEIGRGQYGVVYEATWLTCRFVVKLVQAIDVNALLKEVEILSRLHHPHILQLIGFGMDGNTCKIVMEKMEGDLHKLMKSLRRQPPFKMDVAVDIISQIAAGMLYLHNQGIFHGDLRPSNILVDFKGVHPRLEIKIGDFGVSQCLRLEKCLENDIIESRDVQEESISSQSHSSVYSGSFFSGTVGSPGFRAPEVYPLASQKMQDKNLKPLSLLWGTPSCKGLSSLGALRIQGEQNNNSSKAITNGYLIEHAKASMTTKIDLSESSDQCKARALVSNNTLDESCEPSLPCNITENELHEVEVAEPTYSAKADVFSFAMTASEILTGKLPFTAYTRSTICSKMIDGDRPILPTDLNTRLASLIKDCWNTDPEKRPPFSKICEVLEQVKASSLGSIASPGRLAFISRSKLLCCRIT